MERRNFIKKSLIAAGSLTLADNLLTATDRTAFSALKAENARLSQNTTPLRKSIMWGTVGLQGSVLEKCKAIKEAGFDGVEPNSHADRKEMMDAMTATGLKASSVCNSKHWQTTMSDPNIDVRREGIKNMIIAMEDAQSYGTDVVLLVPGRVDENTSYEDCWNRSTECIKELVPTAEKMQIKICIENVWNNFLLSPVEMRMYIEQFKSKFVGSYFDCGNILVYGWPEQWIKTLGDRVVRIHIKEYSKQIADKQGRSAGWGVKLTEGDVRWKEVMNEIKDNYKGGWLTTEQGNSRTLDDLKDLSARFDKILAMY